LNFIEEGHSKLAQDIVDYSNELQKVTFFQERLDTLGNLFKGSEFRLGCVEKDIGALDNNFQQLLKTIELDTHYRMDTKTENNEMNDYSNKLI